MMGLLLIFPIWCLANCIVAAFPFALLRGRFNGRLLVGIVACTAVCYVTIVFFNAGMGWLIGGQHEYSRVPQPPYQTLLLGCLLGFLPLYVIGTCSWILLDLRPIPKVKFWHVLVSLAVISALFMYGASPFIVEHRAAAIAKDRPYCIMVASKRAWEYDDVTRRSQLAFGNMQAGTSESGGSRGPFYTTGHAMLVLDNPREYLNWSYYAQNFVPEALVQYVSSYKNGMLHTELATRICEPKPRFIDTLN